MMIVCVCVCKVTTRTYSVVRSVLLKTCRVYFRSGNKDRGHGKSFQTRYADKKLIFFEVFFVLLLTIIDLIVYIVNVLRQEL